MLWNAMSIMGHNVFGLGAVERHPVRWGNCAKPVLAGEANSYKFKILSDGKSSI